jgi:hypothetical protein
MDYEFFLSYSRSDITTYLERFYNDLSDEIRSQRGIPRDGVVGFFDQHDIQLGASWEGQIAEALEAAKVMVCIYSPGYFKNPYCGKEWKAFYDRCEYSLPQGTSRASTPGTG